MSSAQTSAAQNGAPPSAFTRLTRNIALFSLLSLIALCLAWELWLAPTGTGSLAIKALPLMAGVLGLWRYRLYTFRWLSLLVWLYVAEGSVRAYGDKPPSSALAMAEVLLALILFTACAWHVCLRFKAARAQAATATSPSEHA